MSLKIHVQARKHVPRLELSVSHQSGAFHDPLAAPEAQQTLMFGSSVCQTLVMQNTKYSKSTQSAFVNKTCVLM